MKNVFVTITDDEGFNTDIVGPFTQIEANKWISEMNETYDGCCQEPYQSFVPVTPQEYKKLIED